jgi:Ni2+-binding GTPase involved in maturation of urease and hydrogenase
MKTIPEYPTLTRRGAIVVVFKENIIVQANCQVKVVKQDQAKVRFTIDFLFLESTKRPIAKNSNALNNGGIE